MLRLKSNWIILIYRNAVSLTNNKLLEKQEKHFNTFSWKNQFGWKFSSRLLWTMILYWKTLRNDCWLFYFLHAVYSCILATHFICIFPCTWISKVPWIVRLIWRGLKPPSLDYFWLLFIKFKASREDRLGLLRYWGGGCLFFSFPDSCFWCWWVFLIKKNNKPNLFLFLK